MKGLDNIGNTCYLNSGLQMLIQNKDLCKLILTYSNKSDILKKISNFILEYNNDSNTSINPIQIKKIVEKKQNIFIGSHQHDSTEFIIYLLDIIDEEIKNIDKESKGIEPLFSIDINVRIKCKIRECLTIYNHNEKNNFLLLDINLECSSLDDAYRAFKSSEKLDLDNKYFCEKCKDKRISSKRNEIINWPLHLFIWLKRYSQDKNNNIKKNNSELDIPLLWRHDLELHGAVIHHGSLNGGHYIYIGKNNNKWYLFNDSMVSEINSDSSVKSLISKAYWLYYKKN